MVTGFAKLTRHSHARDLGQEAASREGWTCVRSQQGRRWGKQDSVVAWTFYPDVAHRFSGWSCSCRMPATYNVSTQVTTGTKFAYDAAGNIWADLNSSNQLVDRRLFVDVNGQTQPFARIDASGHVSWYLTDHLGSVRLITDNSAAVIDQIDYDAWGNITNETNAANGDRYKYASGQYDAVLGMTLYAHNSTGRWYMASNGNWLNADPTGLAAGPNPYDYVGNNPTDSIDPSGLEQIKIQSVPLTVLEQDYYIYNKYFKKVKISFSSVLL